METVESQKECAEEKAGIFSEDNNLKSLKFYKITMDSYPSETKRMNDTEQQKERRMRGNSGHGSYHEARPIVLAKSNSRRPNGFTMLELLMVISIIIILASILLPAFGKGRAMVKRISCVNNLRQIAQGIVMYTNDYSDWLPDAATYKWAETINVYMRQKNMSGYVSLKPIGIFFCPEISDAVSSPCWNGDVQAVYYTTNYAPTKNRNDFSDSAVFGGWDYGITWVPTQYRRLNRITPGSMIMGELNFYQSDSTKNLTHGYVYRFGFSSWITNQYAPAWNHNKNANFLFKDGHVQSLRYNGQIMINTDFVLQ